MGRTRRLKEMIIGQMRSIVPRIWTILGVVILPLIAVIVAFSLCACGSAPIYLPNYRPDLREDKPYPAVATLKLDGIPFGFRIRFYPGLYEMDVPATVSYNMLVSNDSREALEVMDALDSRFPQIMRPLSGPEITFRGSPPRQERFSRLQIEYQLKVDGSGVLLEFVKEISVHNVYCSSPSPISADELRQSLFKAFGMSPHSMHTEDHPVSHVDTYWWGIDETVLSRGGAYNFLNAYLPNKFFGKVIRADLYQYKDGDIHLTVTMTDNYRWLQKMLSKVHPQN